MKKRLEKTDWLNHGIQQLSLMGSSALKAEPLARSLGVSRGSFYWHFRNLDDFHQCILQDWRQRTTGRIIAEADSQVASEKRFGWLIARALNHRDPVERAIRSWAAESDKAAKVVAEVDRQRTRYLTTLLVASGLSKAVAESRATFTYCAYLGQLMLTEPTGQAFKPARVQALAKLLQT